MNALTTRQIRKFKKRDSGKSLKMLTCYDYQSAKMLSETDLDMILVGDSLGNVILGLETTIPVTLEMMEIFGSAVVRGAKNKFVVVDLPFGTYFTVEKGLESAITLFQKTQAQAVKVEGAFNHHLKLIKELTHNGVPVVGHIGLTPQSVHEMGGYYTHGKEQESAQALINQAVLLQEAGVFALVLECVEAKVAQEITQQLSIPTIGIGSGLQTDGQVLVLNDLLKMGPTQPPKFCQPVADLYQVKKGLVQEYLNSI